jgi:hypothetical protein
MYVTQEVIPGFDSSLEIPVDVFLHAHIQYVKNGLFVSGKNSLVLTSASDPSRSSSASILYANYLSLFSVAAMQRLPR